MGMGGVPRPALLKSTSSRRKVARMRANSTRTSSGLLTSVGTASIRPSADPAISTVRSSSAARLPASTTEYPAAWSAKPAARPMPLPAPVTSAILEFELIRSTVDEGHEAVVIALARHHVGRQRRIQPRHLVRGQHYLRGADVLFQVGAPLGAGNGHNVRAFVQNPGQRDLRGRAALARCHLADHSGGAHIGGEVLALKPR